MSDLAVMPLDEAFADMVAIAARRTALKALLLGRGKWMRHVFLDVTMACMLAWKGRHIESMK